MEVDNFFIKKLDISSGPFEHLMGNLLIICLIVLESNIILYFIILSA